MSDENCKVITAPQKMQMDIEELKLNYGKLDKDLEQFHVEYEQTNKSIEEIIQKLDKFSQGYSEKGTEMNGKNNIVDSIKDCITHSLKNIAVGTLSVVYSIVDKTAEKTSSFKEGFEDIAAEAQYVNKQRKWHPVETN